jgi:hypothetical protein
VRRSASFSRVISSPVISSKFNIAFSFVLAHFIE